MDKFKKWVSHYQGTFVAILICGTLAIYVFGCQSKVTSLITPEKKITGDELKVEFEKEAARLELELENLVKSADVKFREIERQDIFKQKLTDLAMITTQTGTINPAGIVGLAIGVLGIGASVDNRIKDKIIKNRPLPKKEV